MSTISTLPSAAGNITDSSTDYHLVTLKFLVCLLIIIRERCGPSNDQSVAKTR